MSDDTYFQVAGWVIIFNTVPMGILALLCFWWVYIAKSQVKKTLFATSAGVLILFCVIRTIVALLFTPDPGFLIVIGVLHGIVMHLVAFLFGAVTIVIHKRTAEINAIQACRSAAQCTPVVKSLTSIEDELMAIGRAKGWC